MVIGFDGSRAFEKDKTGTENYSYQLLKHLLKIDVENDYIVYIRPGSKINSSNEVRSKNDENSSRLRSNNNSRWPENVEFKVINFQKLWTQAGLALQTFKDKLDILFIPAHTLPIIRNPKLKTVVTVHDLGAEYLPKMHQLKQRLYLKFMTHKQLKSATKIIAVSKATKQDLIKRVGLDPRKIEVIYEGVNREVFKPVKNDQLINSLKQFDLEKGKYFLFVGTIQPRKNLERLIKAFSLLFSRGPVGLYPHSMSSVATLPAGTQRGSPTPATPRKNHLKLVLVGAKGWLSDEIYELPKKLGIEEKVKFLRRVEDEDLAALYSGAIALTYPSLFEGFGLPILEAMSCGTPVITSNTSSMPEVAGDGAILINPENIDEIAKALEDLISNDKLRDNLILKGFKQVEKFSWEKAARETLKVFKSL